MRAYLELPKFVGLPSFLEGRHPLHLTANGQLADADGELLDGDTFVRFRDELSARILTNSPGKVAQALGFSDGCAPGVERAVKVSCYPKPNVAAL